MDSSSYRRREKTKHDAGETVALNGEFLLFTS